MFQDAMDLTDSGLLELRKRLEAYADARLTPSVAATTRMRTNVMAAAHRRAALIAADGTLDAAGANTVALVADRAGAATNAWRKPAAAVLAGFLTLGVLVGTASATKPGGPLYAARVWTEMANLPAGVVARAEAEISRLDARLTEAQQASAAGDGPATTAALAAYSVIVIEAGRESSGDATASAAIELTVTRHVVVLTLMIDSVPPPARAAVEHALSTNAMVLDDLDGPGPQGGRGRPVDAGGSGTTRPDGTTPVRPGQSPDPSPAASHANSKVDKNAARDEDGRVRDSDPRRTGQGGQGGGGNNDDPADAPPAHPTGPPDVPDKPGGPDKDGDT